MYEDMQFKLQIETGRNRLLIVIIKNHNHHQLKENPLACF